MLLLGMWTGVRLLHLVSSYNKRSILLFLYTLAMMTLAFHGWEGPYFWWDFFWEFVSDSDHLRGWVGARKALFGRSSFGKMGRRIGYMMSGRFHVNDYP